MIGELNVVKESFENFPYPLWASSWFWRLAQQQESLRDLPGNETFKPNC